MGWQLFKRFLVLAFLVTFFLLSGIDHPPTHARSKKEDAPSSTDSWRPKGEKIVCPVTKDTSISSIREEQKGGNGRAIKLKVKGQQEYILLDIDPSPLEGRIITGALLHVRSASPRKAPLARLGVSTLAAEWVEGTSSGYRPEAGSSCYSQAEYKKRDWAYSGSTLMDVVFGRGHTIWKFADCMEPDRQGWQACAVDPDVVAARAAGLSHGFCVYDEVGSEWSIKNGEFNYTYFPNRFCFSRESVRNAPYLEVWTEATDSIPPEPIASIHVNTDSFPPGEALISWNTPKDKGGGKTLGFLVSYVSRNQEKEMPRYLVPMARNPGNEVRMHIQDLPFEPGESIVLTVRPVDSCGNIGQPFTKTIQLSSNPSTIEMPESNIKPFAPCIELPTVGGLKVAVIDLLDKINPVTCEMIPPREVGYRGGNHIFSGPEKRIRLHGAKNEAVCFQLNLEGRTQNIRVDYAFEDSPDLQTRIYQFAYVKTLDEKGKHLGFFQDPLLPLEDTLHIPSTAGGSTIPGQTNTSLICQVYIPHEEKAGIKQGKISIAAGGQEVVFKVELHVWNFTLPNKLSFIPEMNVYWGVTPYEGYEYYRLAHEHRTCINRLPYGWHGVPFFSPTWRRDGFAWEEWDAHVGPLLDGTAFRDMPRAGEPVDFFYLPLNENWPVNIFEHYRPSYWADEAFTSQYSDALKKAFSAFARHSEEKKWFDTIFQFYLNNKVYHRKTFVRNSAPWIFDEPMNTQDFWALRWYGMLWHGAVDPVMQNAKMWFRGDISYGQFGRNILWGITNIEYVGGNDSQKMRMKRDEQILSGPTHFAEYGTANKIEAPNTQPVLWCLSAWSKGAVGVLPWQTLGSKECWKKAEQTALFYPHPTGPKPSVRLKAFCRGQQDVEYLELFCDVFEKPRYALANWLKKTVDLEGHVSHSHVGDAGTPSFLNASIEGLWEMRLSVGNRLSAEAPPYKRKLVGWYETGNKRNLSLPDIGYVPVAPKVPSSPPVCDRFAP